MALGVPLPTTGKKPMQQNPAAGKRPLQTAGPTGTPAPGGFNPGVSGVMEQGGGMGMPGGMTANVMPQGGGMQQSVMPQGGALQDGSLGAAPPPSAVQRPGMQVNASRMPLPGNMGNATNRAGGGGTAGPAPQNPSVTAALDAAAAAAGVYGNAGYYEDQMAIIQQMMGATDNAHLMDLMAQLSQLQSQGNSNALTQSQAQQGYAQQQWGQQSNYIDQQIGFSQQGYGLDIAQINQQRYDALQQAGLSADQAKAVMMAEHATGQTAYETGMATATQQRDYGMGKAGQWRDTSQMARRSDATARGATGSEGFGQQWKDIANEYGLETSNIEKTFDIRKTYESETWQNLQAKIDRGWALNQREYEMLEAQAHAEADLQGQAAWLQHQQTYAGLSNQWQQGNIANNSAQSGFGAEQQKIELAEQMRDIQYQMQMAQMNNPSAMLGLQMQYNQMQQQMQASMTAALPGIYAGAQAGLPAPWSPSAPAWQPPAGWGTGYGGGR